MYRITILLFSALVLLAQNPNTASYPSSAAGDSKLAVAARLSESTLATSVNSSTTTVVVASGSSFLNYQIIRIDNEEMQICSKSTNTLTICSGTRGFNGTTAASHTAGVAVRGIITSWHHNQLAAEVKALTGALAPIPFSSFPSTCIASKQLQLRSNPASAGQILYVCNSGGNGWNLVGDGAGSLTASGISVTPVGNISSTDVQAALAELDTEKALASHTHAGSAIGNTAAGNIAATNVQAAINELDTEKSPTSHTHAGSAVTSTPAGSLSSTDVQAALNELDTEKLGLKQFTELTGNLTISSTHCGGLLIWTAGAPTLTIPAPGTLPTGCWFIFSLYNTSNATFTASTSSINGTSSITQRAGSYGIVANNGTGWYVLTANPIVTSSSIDVTNSGTLTTLRALNTRALVANAGSTGTTLSHLAKINSSGNAVIVSTSDTSGAVGIVVSGDGTSGTASIQQIGAAILYPATSSVAGQYVGISSATAGRGSSSSSCPSGQNIGIWLESGDSSSARGILLGNFCSGSSGGGATTTSGLTDLDLTKNSSTVVQIAAGVYAKGNAPSISFAGATFTIQSISITSCTNAAPIVCTLASSIAGMSPRTGDTIMVSGVATNTAANGTWIAEVIDGTHIKLTGSTGNGSGTGGTMAGSGSGTCQFDMTPNGYANANCSSSAGLILSCTGNCNMNQSTTPAPDPYGLNVGTVTVTSGAWNTATKGKAMLNSGESVQCGTGMTCSPAGGVNTVAVDSSVVRGPADNVITGTIRAQGASRTAPCREGTGAPTGQNGTRGECYFQTDATAGSNMWWATASGTPATWTQSSAGGSSSSLVVYRLPFMTAQDPGGVSPRWVGLWHSTNTLSLTTLDASTGTCANTSSLAECGNQWYSLADASQSYRTTNIWIPTGWTSGTVKFFLTFATSSSADPAFQVKTRCMTSGSAPSSYNTAQNLPTGTVASGNTYTRSVTLTTTGCAANRPMTISLTRTDSNGGYAVMFDAFVEVQVQ